MRFMRAQSEESPDDDDVHDNFYEAAKQHNPKEYSELSIKFLLDLRQPPWQPFVTFGYDGKCSDYPGGKRSL